MPEPSEPKSPEGSMRGPAYRKGLDGVELSHQRNVANQMKSQARYNEALRRAVNAESVPGVDVEADGVGDVMNIDSPVHNHYGDSNSKRIGTLAKLGLFAGLVASGAGIGSAVTLVIDALRQKPVVESPDTDTDTIMILELVE